MTLSVAGLGVLLTFLNLKTDLTLIENISFLFASSSYLICIYSIITIFGKNAELLVKLISDQDCTQDEATLRKYDKTAKNSFYLAILFSFILSISASNLMISFKNQIKEIVMSEEQKTKPSTKGHAQDSFSGITEVKKSIEGISKLKPTGNSNSSGKSNDKK
ncbi:hypothetical protein JQC92_04720 [Shewanella sp. 202IG2-18]|uniref:hypothetical protein n=1 Tax=Parashewanella hymeniacidonis TaxID=2807618 RepID=UPI00196200B2|nr:hypothetical protein [Parashewanella hymeniacidonis]MBM7071346.1 hypothetical protein [Parashewanella hymeniacidonis]